MTCLYGEGAVSPKNPTASREIVSRPGIAAVQRQLRRLHVDAAPHVVTQFRDRPLGLSLGL
jgi:hypothetical protein